MGNISIKEIAKHAGVSSATVSRVFNNNGRFSEEIREKVLSVIEKYEYTPNIVAKSLRTKRSKSIGVIVPDISNEFFSQVILAIENYCFKKGYSVSVCNTNEDEKKEKLYLKDLETKGVDGLIYIAGGTMDILSRISKKKIPMVFVDRRPRSKDIIIVESDNYGGGFMATEELIRVNCKKIVILKDYRDVTPSVYRFKGYIDALKKYGLPIDPKLVLGININVNSARDAILKLIRENIAFDGVFATTDWLAIGTLDALRQSNVKVPQEVKIVGFDNIPFTEYSYPKITTINQNKQKIGKVSAEKLLEMIDGSTFLNKDIIIPVQLVRRESS